MFNIFKGWLGEKTTQLGMWINLDSKIYKRFHDLILNSRKPDDADRPCCAFPIWTIRRRDKEPRRLDFRQ